MNLMSPEQSKQLESKDSSDLRRNFISCLIDSAGWTFGIAFFSTSTIVPAFLTTLGAGTLLIGVLPAIVTLGYAGCGIFSAGYIRSMPLARRWLFPMALLERVPLLVMGLLVLSLPPSTTLLWLFIALYCLHAVTNGLNQPAYWVVIAKSIPQHWRGRLFGAASLAGGACGFAVLPIAETFLHASGNALALGFGRCFLAGAVILFVTTLPLGLVREPWTPPGDISAPTALDRVFFRSIWRGSAGFRNFVVGQAFFSVWMIAGPFYLLDGILRLHVDSLEVALYASVGAVTAALGGALCGMLSDRKGNRVVLLIACAAGCCGSFYALFSTSPMLLAIVFACSSFAGAGCGIAGSNITMEFAPSDKDVPHYVAFYNLAMAPVRALSLVAGGWISSRYQFAPVFWISAVAAAASLFFTWRLQEPRRRAVVGGSPWL